MHYNVHTTRRIAVMCAEYHYTVYEYNGRPLFVKVPTRGINGMGGGTGEIVESVVWTIIVR